MNATARAKPFDLKPAIVVALIPILFVSLWLVERWMGRSFLSDSGFGVWTGANTRDTSQWMFDPYWFSHVLHGVLFYWVLFPTRRWLGTSPRFLLAGLVEACWEIAENTPFIVDRYRTATISLDYYGDSILNSIFDLLAAMLGFGIAWKLGWKWALAFFIATELLLLYFVRDNLTLNILMLLHPSDAIRRWQMGA